MLGCSAKTSCFIRTIPGWSSLISLVIDERSRSTRRPIWFRLRSSNAWILYARPPATCARRVEFPVPSAPSQSSLLMERYLKPWSPANRLIFKRAKVTSELWNSTAPTSQRAAVEYFCRADESYMTFSVHVHCQF